MTRMTRMTRTVAADPCDVARTRREFAGWLHRRVGLVASRHGDVVLAVHEALANAVEFGCRHRAGHHGVAFAAAYDEHTRTLTVTVTDRGRWRLAAVVGTPPTTRPGSRRRGRGIALMRALSDELRIDPSQRGTQVSLTWTDVR